MPGFVTIIIWLVVAVIGFSFLYWVIQNYIPDPMKKFAMLVLMAIGVIFIIWCLLNFAGGSSSLPHHVVNYVIN